MTLPVLPKKTFTMKSEFLSKGKVELQPFTVGQESILLSVKDSKDKKEILLALKQIIQECILTKGVDVGKLPVFVVEEIFLRLREQSIGEIQEMKYRCTKEVEGVECGGTMPLSLDYRHMKLVKPEGHNNTVIVADSIGLKFKYPSIDLYEKAEDEIKEEKDLLIECIECIFDGDTVYPASEHSKEELLAFWNQFTLKQKTLVYESFFGVMPHLHYEAELTCPKCNGKHTLELNSLYEVFQ